VELLNNREIAIAVWLLVGLAFASSNRPVRKSMVAVLRAFFQPKKYLWLSMMLLYTLGTVAILYATRFWEITLLKGTVFWFFFSGVVLAFSFVISQNNENVFSKVISNNVKVVVILEFLVGSYTFHIAAELVIVPLVTMIVMFGTVADLNQEHSSVAKAMMGLQIIIGLVILFYAIVSAISDYENFGSIATLKNFLLAPILSLMFTPFIYFMLVFTKYEQVFIRLDLGPEKDKAVKRYAKRRIISYCRWHLNKIQHLLRIHSFDLMRIRSEDDVNRILKADRNLSGES
jgi:hypothetical protein